MFADLLQQMIERTDGAEAAVIAGFDGMLVERAGKPQTLDLELLSAEYASLLSRSLKSTSDTGLGNLREMMVQAEGAVLLIKILSPEYFLLLLLASQGNAGRARFEMRKAQLILEHEFVM